MQLTQLKLGFVLFIVWLFAMIIQDASADLARLSETQKASVTEEDLQERNIKERLPGASVDPLAKVHAIDWNDENSAINCDFSKTTDLKVVFTDCSRCRPLCSSNENCTHFTCKLRQCTLKTGLVTRAAATYTFYSSVCGIIRQPVTAEVTKAVTSGRDLAMGLSISFGIIVASTVGFMILLWRRRQRARKPVKTRPEIPMVSPPIKPDNCVVSPLILALEIPSRTIHMVDGRILGRGHFGEVLLAKIHGWEKNGITEGTQVAIKRLKSITADTKSSFLREATLMADIGRHANIANLLGVTTIGDTWMILEYCELGSLITYLKTVKTENNSTSEDMYRPVEFAYQIARGMVFLSHKQIVHRDLAARNILVTGDFLLKIADFGLAVKTEGNYLDPDALRKKMPVKWMCPESLSGGVFCEKTDIWSYGVVLWEIYSLGDSPYNDLAATECLKDFVKVLTTGYRMKAPDNMPTFMCEIMSRCWEASPTNRPAFTDIKRELQDSCREDYYLSFDMTYEEYNNGLEQLLV